MGLAIDVRHGCASGGKPLGAAIPVQQKASSACCGAKLVPGPAGRTCAACSKPATRALGPKTAHWTCDCGTRRSQVITEAQDEES